MKVTQASLRTAKKPNNPLVECYRVGHRMTPVRSNGETVWICNRCARIELAEG